MSTLIAAIISFMVEHWKLFIGIVLVALLCFSYMHINSLKKELEQEKITIEKQVKTIASLNDTITELEKKTTEYNNNILKLKSENDKLDDKTKKVEEVYDKLKKDYDKEFTKLNKRAKGNEKGNKVSSDFNFSND